MKLNCFRSKKKPKEKKVKEKKAYGLIDKVINNLPEIHIPGYQYCGPGTDLEKRLARGDIGINKLDAACKDHDIAYNKKDSKGRYKADAALVTKAFKRIFAKNSSLSERAAALLVTSLIGTKMGLSKIGFGIDDGRIRKRKKKTTKRSTNTITQRPRRRRQRRSQCQPLKSLKKYKRNKKVCNFAGVLNLSKFSQNVIPCRCNTIKKKASGFYLKPYTQQNSI